MKFKTMDEANTWVLENKQPIRQQDCPKVNMSNPTMEDINEYDTICDNRWGCHTWRHIMGSREKEHTLKLSELEE